MEVKLDLRMTPRISAGGRKERPFCPCLILDSNTDVVVGSDMKVEVVEFISQRQHHCFGSKVLLAGQYTLLAAEIPDALGST